MKKSNYTSPETFRQHLENTGAALVYFYSNSCTPCMQLRPKVTALIEESYDDLELILVDSAEYPAITASFGAFSFPTILLMFEGKEYKRYSKYVSMAALQQDIDRLSALYFGS
jgi:thioredoxin-like negative regulator of GroEL